MVKAQDKPSCPRGAVVLLPTLQEPGLASGPLEGHSLVLVGWGTRGPC